MKRLSLSLCALVLTVTLEPARAQVTLDVSKITCEQFRLYTIADPRDIALWINGYFNGQRKNTVLDTQKLKGHFDKLKDYCVLNPKLSVFDATQKVLEMDK
jgi:acid stress chaperone HdeB